MQYPGLPHFQLNRCKEINSDQNCRIEILSREDFL